LTIAPITDADLSHGGRMFPVKAVKAVNAGDVTDRLRRPGA
jgi:hypothetical protein